MPRDKHAAATTRRSCLHSFGSLRAWGVSLGSKESFRSAASHRLTDDDARFDSSELLSLMPWMRSTAVCRPCAFVGAADTSRFSNCAAPRSGALSRRYLASRLPAVTPGTCRPRAARSPAVPMAPHCRHASASRDKDRHRRATPTRHSIVTARCCPWFHYRYPCMNRLRISVRLRCFFIKFNQALTAGPACIVHCKTACMLRGCPAR